MNKIYAYNSAILNIFSSLLFFLDINPFLGIFWMSLVLGFNTLTSHLSGSILGNLIKTYIFSGNFRPRPPPPGFNGQIIALKLISINFRENEITPRNIGHILKHGGGVDPQSANKYDTLKNSAVL